MNRNAQLQVLQQEHQALREAIHPLGETQMLKEIVADGWTPCDILAHCASWNWYHLQELDRILENRATWHTVLTPEYVDDYNHVELEKRRGRTIQETVFEWEESFEALFNRIESLSEEEWEQQSRNDCWDDGRRMTVASLFDYQYKGNGHEGGHAKDITEYY